MKRQMDDMAQEVSEKNSYTASEVGKVKVDLNKAQSKLEQERTIQNELREKLSNVDSQMSEQLLKHRQVMEEKEKELVTLQEKMKGRDLELVRMREEEAQRVQILQSAILNYVGTNRGSASPR